MTLANGDIDILQAQPVRPCSSSGESRYHCSGVRGGAGGGGQESTPPGARRQHMMTGRQQEHVSTHCGD